MNTTTVSLDLLKVTLIRLANFYGEVMHNSKNVYVINQFTADDESIFTNPQEIIDHFNDYFVNIGSKLAASILPSTTRLVTL